MTVTWASGDDLDLAGLHGERLAPFRSYVQAELDRILDVHERLLTADALGNTAWNSRAFHDPNAVFVAIDRNLEAYGTSLGMHMLSYASEYAPCNYEAA
jgi:hypothetical protein